MVKSEALERISIPQHAGQLREPFTMIDLVQIDELMLSIYLCQGTIPRHRHLDQDELFLVHSDWGRTILRTGELAVVPKGVGHRSSSLLHSLVLLLQPRLMTNRRNGDRHLFALEGEGRLEKVSVPAVGQQIQMPYTPVVLTDLDTVSVYLLLCRGEGPWERSDRQDCLVYCYEGYLTVVAGEVQVSLEEGELVVVPKGIDYRLSSPSRALVLSIRRHKQPGLPLPD
jgi:mannose-6-phosphate isomerase-like protein (cupin superfamily)